MLRIKDNVELKELEKYGFFYWENGCGTKGYSKHFIRGSMDIIEKENEFKDKSCERKISESYIDIDTLYDLIKDNLLEKVEEE